jgi:hypothetical protein
MKRSTIGIKSFVRFVLVLTFLIPINVFAEPPFYIALKPGVYSPQSSDLEGADTGFNGEIAFGYRFNPNIAAEIGTGYFTMGNFDINVFPLTLTLKAILPYKRWEFFGLAGGGVYIVSAYDYGESDTDAVLGGYLGGGLHYNITPRVFVGWEGKYLWTDKAKLRSEAYGVPLEGKFRMDGIITTAVIGFRF